MVLLNMQFPHKYFYNYPVSVMIQSLEQWDFYCIAISVIINVLLQTIMVQLWQSHSYDSEVFISNCSQNGNPFFFLSSFYFNAALGAFFKILVSLSVSSTVECFLLFQTHTVRSLVFTCQSSRSVCFQPFFIQKMLERQLSNQEHLLILYSTWAPFPARTQQQLTVTCSPNSQGSDSFSHILRHQA